MMMGKIFFKKINQNKYQGSEEKSIDKIREILFGSLSKNYNAL